MDGSTPAVPSEPAGSPLPGPPDPMQPSRSFRARLLGAVAAGSLMLVLVIVALGFLIPRAVTTGARPRGGDPEGTTVAGDEGETRSDGTGRAADGVSAAQGGSDEDGDLIPDFDPLLFHNRLEAVSGGEKPVWEGGAPATLVDFWASWCGPCLVELPHLEELQDRIEKRGMRVVLVNVDLGDAHAAGRFLQRRGIHLDSLVDRDAVLFQAIGLEALPSTFVLDASGRPVAFFEGGVSRDELETALLRANEKRVRTTFR